MIKNYMAVALRGLRKNKSYVFINTMGLGISLACCITAYLLLAYNIEFDNFHKPEKVSNIFKVHTLGTDKEGKATIDNQAPIIMAPIMAEEIAGVERYTRFLFGGGALRYGNNAFNESIAFADSSFFDLFDYPLMTGSHRSFKEKNTIFLTPDVAKKYFGSEDPIGKFMVLNGVNDIQIELLVGGVLKKFPANNTFMFNILMRMENFMDMHKIKIDDWSDWRNPATFIELASAGSAASVSKELDRYVANRNAQRTDMVVKSYQLEPFLSNFNEDQIRWNWVSLRISLVPLVVFTAMATLILLIACFNLTNTSIAMTARRLKEVGIRKAVGAARSQIVSQFLLETLITISLALVVALLVAQIIVPAFVNMWHLPYSLTDLDGVNLFISLVILVFLAALIAGIYPALFSSKFRPTILLKGNVQIKGTNILTRSLVGAQFALSVIVLIGGVVFYLNARFQDKISFGYDKDMVLIVNILGESDYEVISNAISSNPKILEVASSDGNLGNSNYQTPIKIDTAELQIRAMGVGKNYFETMGLRFIEGRPFNLDNTSDQEEGVVVNKAFIEKTMLDEPLEKTFILHNKRRLILGVVDNHVDNVYRSKGPEPFVFYPAAKNNYVMLLVRAEKSDLPEVKIYIEKTWKEIFPAKPFECYFQDEAVLKGSRETNANLKKIFLFITVLGGLLSAAGIFALASLNIAKRTKEIGIRKALGASINSIVALLNKEFIIVLSIAALLGSAGGYFLTNALLKEIYSYHIPVELVPVAISALIIFAIGIFTTSATILKAARANPVDTLRTE